MGEENHSRGGAAAGLCLVVGILFAIVSWLVPFIGNIVPSLGFVNGVLGFFFGAWLSDRLSGQVLILPGIIMILLNTAGLIIVRAMWWLIGGCILGRVMFLGIERLGTMWENSRIIDPIVERDRR